MKQQHFHVKFLKGYGFSISVKDSKLVLKNCYDLFSKPEIEEWFVKDMPYDRIVLQGKGYISTESLSLLSENNRAVVFLNNRGKQVSFCHGMRESLTATKYRITQYDTFRDKSKTDYLTQQITKAKIQSQIKFLKFTNTLDVKEGIVKLSQSGLSEAVSSRIYFDNYTKLIDDRFEFKKRNSVIIEKKKVGTLKLNIKQNTLDNIGAFTTVTKKLKLNGDRGRQWWGKLSDVRLKERNISTPFSFLLDDPKKM